VVVIVNTSRYPATAKLILGLDGYYKGSTVISGVYMRPTQVYKAQAAAKVIGRSATATARAPSGTTKASITVR
jgi:hypothetical protein